VSDDDQQPIAHAQRSRISRDTLLLLGALSFLIVAVALTFLFTPGSTPEIPPTATAAAEAYPVATLVSELPAYPAPYPTPFGQGEPYPTPFGQGEPTPTPFGHGEPTPTPFGRGEPYPTPFGQGEPTPTLPVPDAAFTAYPLPVGEGTPPPLPTFSPESVTPIPPEPPTLPPLPTPEPPTDTAVPEPQPTIPLPEPTATVELAPSPTPFPTRTPPPPADTLRGSVRWSSAQSPITLVRDLQIAPGAELLIEPGVEVRLDPGVSIYVDGGRLIAVGLADRPIRFIGAGGMRWSGIFGRPNSFVFLEHVEVRGGGVGGSVMALEQSELVIRASRFNDNGGAIVLTDTRLDLRDSEIAGNDLPFGASLEADYSRGNYMTLIGNRIGGNRLTPGTPQVRITHQSGFDTLNLTLERNLFRDGTPNLQLVTNGTLQGTLRCNSMIGDAQGFSLRTRTAQIAPNGLPPMALRIEDNQIDDHTPPIIPIYLEFGLGRGATSDVMLDMRNNWWGAASGPYEPDTNPLGRGDSVGVNIQYAPWLTAPPACAPR